MRGKLFRPNYDGGIRRIIPAHAGQTPYRTTISIRRSDHPRACGANPPLPTIQPAARGSSPRMRGKHTELIHHRLRVRIIPAHAGQTRIRRARFELLPDHPRACGANRGMPIGSPTRYGSSPRMRGKLARLPCVGHGERIIPAHAGQTGRQGNLSGARPDHPRACGANMCSASERSARAGSSPRMRGKPHGGTAWAPARTDHPRACGANRACCPPSTGRAGSSPRMRGKRTNAIKAPERRRIIPAHAGQTAWLRCSCVKSADHPRACGANAMQKNGAYTGNGSSPRMRGKRSRQLVRLSLDRIIPAHAGQTSSVSSSVAASADHPRACGANHRQPVLHGRPSGSSPRMRGKRRLSSKSLK